MRVDNAENGEWSPCDAEPVMIEAGTGGRLQAVFWHELWNGCSIYSGRTRKKPMLGRLPHYYTCPVLLRERRDWAGRHTNA